ncbi:MAG: DinB family protein [Cyclobacteriaceae bacterium]
MKYKLLIITLLGWFGGTFKTFAQSIDSVFIQSAFQKLENSRSYTLLVAKAMPIEKYDFRPSKESMTFAQQLHHLAENLGWLSSSYLKSESNPISKKVPTGKDEIIVELELVYDYALQALRDFKVDRLTDQVSFFAGPLTEIQIINLINDHQTHHRGQLLVYLRMNNINPPAYIGW